MNLALRSAADARLAVARDPNSAQAHSALGLAYLEEGQRVAGNAELRRAIELDPRDADAQEWYAIQLLVARDVRDALPHAEAAAELQPENVAATSWHAMIRYYLHDENGAVDGFRTALEINPSYDLAQLGLVAALIERGRYHEAKLALRGLHGGSWSTERALRGLAAIADMRLGLREEAKLETDRLEEARRMGDDDGYVVAALAMEGRRTAALMLRSRMHIERDPYARFMIYLDPLVAPAFRQLGGNV
jgi:Tfp pilus assembly protein PilF